MRILIGVAVVVISLVCLSVWQSVVGEFTMTVITQPVTREIMLGGNPTINLGDNKDGVRIDLPRARIRRYFRFPWQKALRIEFIEVLDLWDNEFYKITIEGNTFTDTREGVYLEDGKNTIEGNRFEGRDD